MFIVAYLNSSFGQLQFEIHCGNHEGLRKIEQHTINKFKIIDPRLVTIEEMKNVVDQFILLNERNTSFSGDEGINTIRRDLDLAIAEIIYANDDLGFDSVELLVNEYEYFLKDLVEDRRL